MDGCGFIEQDGGSGTNSRITLQDNDSENLGHTNHRDFHTSSQYSNSCSRIQMQQQYEATHATTRMAVSQSQLPGSSYSVRLMHQAYSPRHNFASSQMYSENTISSSMPRSILRNTGNQQSSYTRSCPERENSRDPRLQHNNVSF